MHIFQAPPGRLAGPALMLLLLTAPSGAASPAPPTDLPPPPSGFSWRSIQEIQAHFLSPNGWHFQQIDAALDLDYVLTPQPIETLSDMHMGLRVSVLFETERKKGATARVFGQAAADLFENGGQVLTRSQHQMGPFEITHLLIETQTSPGYLTFFMIFANTDTDTLYWISFSSSIEKWDDAWERFGSQICDGFFLETEV